MADLLWSSRPNSNRRTQPCWLMPESDDSIYNSTGYRRLKNRLAPVDLGQRGLLEVKTSARYIRLATEGLERIVSRGRGGED